MSRFSSPTFDEDVIPLDARRRGQRDLIRVAVTGSVMFSSIIGTGIATQYLLAAGGSAFHVGLMGTLMGLSPLATLPGVHVMPRMGKIGLMIVGRWLSLPLVIAMLVLAGMGIGGTVGLWLAIITIAGLCIMYQVAHTGWWPLLQDNLGPDPMGQYFARLRMRLRGVEIGLPLVIGVFLGAEPATQKFLLPFGLSLVALVVGTFILRHVPQRHVMAPQVGLVLRLYLAARSASVRRCLLFAVAFNFALGLMGPFALVMLTAKDSNPFPGLPSGFVVAMIAVAAVGHMAGLGFWGRVVDRHGNRSVNTISLTGMGLLGLAWLVLPASPYLLMAWTVGFYLVWGFFEGGSLMGRTHAMLRAVPLVYQSDGFTLVTLVYACGSALGAFIGGIVFERLTALAWSLGWEPQMDVRKLYLAISQLGLLVALLLSRRLVGHTKQTPARRVLQEALGRLLPWNTTQQ